MEIVFFIVGFIFAAIGGYIIWDSYRFRRSALEGVGLIVGYDVNHSTSKKGGSSRTYAPVLEYQHSGETYKFVGRLHSSHISGEIGDKVAILISSKNSADARLRSRGMLIFGGIFLLLGLAFMAIFIAIFQISLFSIAIASVVIVVLVFKIKKMLDKHNIRSIDDLRKGIVDYKKSQGSNEKPDDDSGSVITSQQELRSLQRKARVPKALLVVFFIIGLAMLIGGGFFIKYRAEFIVTGSKSTGVIVDFRRETSSSSNGGTTTVYYPVVRYRPSGSKNDVSFKHNSGSSHPSYRRGDRVTVVY